MWAGPIYESLLYLYVPFHIQKSRAADFVNTVTDGGIYCTQFPSDKKFYRVKVKKALPGKV